MSRRLPRAVREFLDTESAGGVVLIVATVVALAWANSPWADSYHRVVALPLELTVGSFSFATDAQHIVSDLLMSLFFFVVGLEIKRELVGGELRSWRAASLPVVAAIGGMIVPAVLYRLVNAGHAGTSGWGIPMATDIAFAVGVLALLGRRVPASLKLFLLTLAVVDDLGAIAVIAVFYSSGLHLVALAIAVGWLLVVIALRRARVTWWPAYVLPVAGVWTATYASGVHATIAGVALALVVSTRPRTGDPKTLTKVAGSTVSPAERMQHALHPAVSYLIIPLFALVNAGVTLTGDLLVGADATRVAAGVVVGLVAGKTIGISLAAAAAVRFGLSTLPTGASGRQLMGVAMIAGIGFTVSLFVANLAFTDPALVDAAKLAILIASVVAAIGGSALLILSSPRPR